MLIRELKLENKYEGVFVEYSRDLTSYSTLQLSGVGDVITVSNVSSLCSVVSDLKKNKCEYRILGKGSNVLIDECSTDPYIKIDFTFEKSCLDAV